MCNVPMFYDKKVVLVCDDSKCCLNAMKRVLQDKYHVITASSGYEAVSFASLYSPDIIILDILMYGMNGFEVISRLKKMCNTKYIPVVFLTGSNSEENKQEGLRLGAVDYLYKPFDVTILLDIIEKHTKD